MSAPGPAPGSESGRRHVLSVAVCLLLLGALAVPAFLLVQARRTSASFGDVEELGLNRLGAATVDVRIGERTAVLRATAMAPGDEATGTIEVENAGDLPLRYSVTTGTTGSPLADWVLWEMWLGASGRCSGAPGPSDTVLVSPRTLPVAGPLTVIGDPAEGVDPGDRPLAVGQSELLCIRAVLAATATNQAQGLSLEQGFTIVAEHDLAASELALVQAGGAR